MSSIVLEAARAKRVLGLIRQSLVTGKPYLPILSCVCFTGENIVSYNESFLTQVDFDFAWKGAVSGVNLTSFLATLPDSVEVELLGHDGALEVRSGKSKIRLPALSQDEFNFPSPSMSQNVLEVPLTPGLLQALEFCLQSCSMHDPTNPEILGISMYLGKSGANFYSTNRKILSRVSVPSLKTKSMFVSVPGNLVKAILEISKEFQPEETPILFLDDEQLGCVFSECTLLGRRIEIKDKPIPFEGVIKDVVGTVNLQPRQIPEDFAVMLTRAKIVMGDELQATHCSMGFASDGIRVHVDGVQGVFDEVIETEQDFPKTDLRLSPVYVSLGLTGCTEIFPVKAGLALFGKDDGVDKLRLIAEEG